MNFEYLKTESYLDSIDIDRLGRCSLEARNDMGERFFLNIETELGWTKITKFGPVRDLTGVANLFNLTHFCQDYDERKLYRLIREFINDSKKAITQVEEIDRDEFKEIQREVLEQLKEVL